MNKKFTLLFLAACIIAVTSNAQINKGVNALGGNLSFYTSTVKINAGLKNTGTDFSISPSFMTAYANNRTVGFNVDYGYNKNSFVDQKINTYGAGVFLRQYKPLGKGFYIFAQETLGLDYTKSTSQYIDSVSASNSKQIYVGLTVNPGLAYDVSKHFQLELLFFNNLISVSYSHTTSTSNAPTVKADNFSLGANLDGSQLTSLNVGAKIFFGR
ncbi:MAG: hypothetical protein ABJB05_07625 [Parafilimonas sp.]